MFSGRAMLQLETLRLIGMFLQLREGAAGQVADKDENRCRARRASSCRGKRRASQAYAPLASSPFNRTVDFALSSQPKLAFDNAQCLRRIPRPDNGSPRRRSPGSGNLG
jgi:hypothetical protein